MTSHEISIGDSQIESSDVKPESSEDTAAIDWEKAQRGTRLLLEAIGEDPDSSHLQDTWQRRVPAFFEEFSAGTRETAKPTMRTFEGGDRNLVIKSGIPVYSLCEHHLLPFHGKAHVAYRPDDAVVGLSKLVRYVHWQARQPTMQEELTQDIARGLSSELDSAAVIVEVRATHLCEAMRGVEAETVTTTRSVAGSPTDAERERFTETLSNNTQ